MRDYYAILGVPRDATTSEIKAAFRRIVRRIHPDVREDKTGAERDLMRTLEAYEVLADPEKRRAYDEGSFIDLYSGAGGFDMSDFSRVDELEDLMAGELLERLFGRRAGRGPQKGRDLRIDVELSLEEAFRGASREVTAPRSLPCPSCGGTGAGEGVRARSCPICSGLGQVKGVRARGSAKFVTIESCPRCRGTGKLFERECGECSGRGRVRRAAPLRVQLPAGVEDGAVLRVPDEGAEGSGGGPRGDLYLVVRVRPHPVFRREGADIHCTRKISFAMAALGGRLRVETLSGSAELRIPPGTQSHTVLRMEGLGMPSNGGEGRGDLLVTVVVATPRSPSARERELIRALEREDGARRGRGWRPWRL
ncbi:MAG: DnaJ C-terminal domain-containing protein [Thermoplasmatota archaeon]